MFFKSKLVGLLGSFGVQKKGQQRIMKAIIKNRWLKKPAVLRKYG
jgi:hypothetical protein